MDLSIYDKETIERARHRGSLSMFSLFPSEEETGSRRAGKVRGPHREEPCRVGEGAVLLSVMYIQVHEAGTIHQSPQPEQETYVYVQPETDSR